MSETDTLVVKAIIDIIIASLITAKKSENSGNDGSARLQLNKIKIIAQKSR